MGLLKDEVSSDDIRTLVLRRDLLALGALRSAYRDQEDAHELLDERYQQLRGAYTQLRATLLREIKVMVGAKMWESKDCQAAHRQVAGTDPVFASYGEADYTKLIQEEVPEQLDDLDLPEELDGYGSDDSDDECAPPALPPKEYGELRRYRAKVQRDKRKHKLRVEKGTATSGKTTRSWRTYGELEPDPNAVVQHVLHLRRQMKMEKDALASERSERVELLMKKKPRSPPPNKATALKKVDAEKVPTSLVSWLAARDAVLADLAAKKSDITERNQRETPAIRHSPGDWTPQAEDDFGFAKALFAQGRVEEIQKLKTRFCIAQYRGITYNNKIFNAEQRRLSRNLKAVGQPVYSMSVLHAAGIQPDDYFEGRCSVKDHANLFTIAQQLKAVLLAKRKPEKVTVNGYEFSSHADAIQDIYTNRYNYIHATIAAYLKHEKLWKEAPIEKSKDEENDAEKPDYPVIDYLQDYNPDKHGPWDAYVAEKYALHAARCEQIDAVFEKKMLLQKFGVVPPSDWALFDGLLNGKNPFVSTGDTPRHALKYAYGMKFYAGHEFERLSPRWNADGKALHPYSGKVFVSLHSLSEYLDDAPNHVPSMNMSARIVVPGEIVDERETTFPAYIAGERVVMEHICKFPSFHRPWRQLFMRKYGLDKASYDELGEMVKGGDVQRDGEYRPLEAWLVNFQEVRLVELVRRYALGQGMLLIYRNSEGELSRTLTSTNAHKGSRFLNSETHKLSSTFDARAERRKGDAPKDDRTTLDPPPRKPPKNPRARPQIAPFLDRIRPEGTVHNVAGDGNCFFHALLAAAQAAAYQPALAWTHATFRAWLVSRYAHHPAIATAQRATAGYIAEMVQVATRPYHVARWGSDAEVILFCHETQSRVIVFSPRFPNDRAEFQAFGVVALRTLYLVHAGGDHWQWLQR